MNIFLKILKIKEKLSNKEFHTESFSKNFKISSYNSEKSKQKNILNKTTRDQEYKIIITLMKNNKLNYIVELEFQEYENRSLHIKYFRNKGFFVIPQLDKLSSSEQFKKSLKIKYLTDLIKETITYKSIDTAHELIRIIGAYLHVLKDNVAIMQFSIYFKKEILHKLFKILIKIEKGEFHELHENN